LTSQIKYFKEEMNKLLNALADATSEQNSARVQNEKLYLENEDLKHHFKKLEVKVYKFQFTLREKNCDVLSLERKFIPPE
jgi:predicted nuclease with TOPRIM domain